MTDGLVHRWKFADWVKLTWGWDDGVLLRMISRSTCSEKVRYYRQKKDDTGFVQRVLLALESETLWWANHHGIRCCAFDAISQTNNSLPRDCRFLPPAQLSCEKTAKWGTVKPPPPQTFGWTIEQDLKTASHITSPLGPSTILKTRSQGAQTTL